MKATPLSLPPFGSTLYFCTRSLPKKTQHALTLLHTLAHTLYEIAERYREYEVAQVKLGWWKEELTLLFQQAARHPLTQKLMPVCSAFGLTSQQYEALLQGVQNSLTVQSYETQTDLEQHFSHTGGMLMLMMAHILQYPQPVTSPDESKLIRAGVGIEIIRHMIEFPFLVQRGHLPLPLKELDALGLEPSALIQKNQSAALTRLLQQQGKRACELMSELLSTTTPTLRPLRQYASLHLALLEQIAQDGFQVLTHQWSLGMLKKYWISRRTL